MQRYFSDNFTVHDVHVISFPEQKVECNWVRLGFGYFFNEMDIWWHSDTFARFSMVPDEICDVTNQVTGSISQSLLAMQLIQRTQIQTYVICQSCFFFLRWRGCSFNMFFYLKCKHFTLKIKASSPPLGPILGTLIPFAGHWMPGFGSTCGWTWFGSLRPGVVDGTTRPERLL